MLAWMRRQLAQRWLALPIIGLLGGYWLLPISGQVIVVPGQGAQALLWPQIQIDPFAPAATEKLTLRVTDVVPWAHVRLTVNGQPADLVRLSEVPGSTWTWHWSYLAPKGGGASLTRGADIAFFSDCNTGCRERGRMAIAGSDRVTGADSLPRAKGAPTKLGLVFANPDRDWHGRSGWVVELTYARLAEEESYWRIDDLAARVYAATAKGLRVLVRVDYDRGQSLPPAGDLRALTEYLRYAGRLARDDRLRGVYGYVVGSGFNAQDGNSVVPDKPVTPAWYARLFNGYGEAASRADNVVQTMRAENPQVKVLVGPVRPWNGDQNGERTYVVDVPWLNYMNSLVAALDEGARAKEVAGIALAAPDGFAVQAPGRPSAAQAEGRDGAEEPRLDLRRPEWGEAQAGFRVYRDWLAIVNGYPTTRGLPVYITSANTYAPDEGTPPAQNYPPGWLTNALQEVAAEPQVLALCWFVDGPLGDSQWDWFSLSRQYGRLMDAAQEWDTLLRQGSQ